jgi:tRNA uridine 5-carbamoylmethylation protein Kti12
MQKDRKALVINLYGGPGVGKSTTAAGVFSLLKLHNIECELVTEYAKDLVWEERHRTIQDQQYLFAKQHHRLWRVADKVDVIVTDCPLMLSPIYGERYKIVNESFTNNVVDVVNGFDNRNIILTRTKKFNRNGRNVTEEQAKEIDGEVVSILDRYNMTWMAIPGNFDGINIIVQSILKEEQKFKISM